MQAPRRWQVMLGRCVALTAICTVGGVLTLLAALLLSLAPSSAISDVRPILLAGCAMYLGGGVSYVGLACLVSFGRGQGLPVPPWQMLPPLPIAANDRHTDDSSKAASGAIDADDDGMPRWDRLSSPERPNDP